MKGAGVEPTCDWRPSWQTVNANPLEAPIGHRVGGAYEWALNVVRTGFEPVIFWLRTRCLGPTRRTDQELVFPSRHGSVPRRQMCAGRNGSRISFIPASSGVRSALRPLHGSHAPTWFVHDDGAPPRERGNT